MAALKAGRSFADVTGGRVQLGRFYDAHGTMTFRGSVPAATRVAGIERKRRNVVQLRWQGDPGRAPGRDAVVDMVLALGFEAPDIFAIIHPAGSPEYDVSFTTPVLMESFISKREVVRTQVAWKPFKLISLSRQEEIKKVTILVRNESIPVEDIVTWLGRYGQIVSPPKKDLDSKGIWTGGWSVPVKLKRAGLSVTHIPSSGYIGRDRILAFYMGQPKLCFKCSSPLHLSASCKMSRCSKCNEVGHLADGCNKIQCNLCGVLGHTFSRCPAAFRTPDASGGSGGPVPPTTVPTVSLPPLQLAGALPVQAQMFVIGSRDLESSSDKGVTPKPGCSRDSLPKQDPIKKVSQKGKIRLVQEPGEVWRPPQNQDSQPIPTWTQVGVDVDVGQLSESDSPDAAPIRKGRRRKKAVKKASQSEVKPSAQPPTQPPTQPLAQSPIQPDKMSKGNMWVTVGKKGSKPTVLPSSGSGPGPGVVPPSPGAGVPSGTQAHASLVIPVQNMFAALDPVGDPGEGMDTGVSVGN